MACGLPEYRRSDLHCAPASAECEANHGMEAGQFTGALQRREGQLLMSELWSEQRVASLAARSSGE